MILTAVEINGIPIFQILAIARFNTDGAFSLTGNMPPGLEGSVITLQALGRTDVNVIAESQLATLEVSE